MFSEEEKKVLEIFVTDAEDPIYALNHNVPPEVFGSFGSFFSRNPKDLREHLLDAIYGRIPGYESEEGKSNIQWLLARAYREPFQAIQSGLTKSRDFFSEWYGKYSHKSIANTVWIPMVATNVSQLWARELAYDQLAFFIEQSTRFVKFDAKNMLQDKEVMKDPDSAKAYTQTLEVLASAYHKLTEIAVTHYEHEIPFQAWLTSQDEKTKGSSERAQKTRYSREIKGKALDFSRFILPQAIKTNIAWIADARSTEFDIAAWKNHPLTEIAENAMLIEKHAGKIAPSLLKYTLPNEYYGRKLHNDDNSLEAAPAQAFGKGIDIIASDPEALNNIVTHVLKKHHCGGSFRQRYEETKSMSFQEKIKVLNTLVAGRNKHDEWVELEEEFDLVKITFEIRSDIGAIRDWRRHQKWDRSEPSYTLENGVHKPFMMQEMPQEAESVFNHAIETAYEGERILKQRFPHQAQYLIPMAAMHTITMSGGLDQLQYMLWTRSTPQGNFSYRQDAFNLAETITRVHPWMLGYESYPEGKEFLHVYANAPLKNLLNLQTEETKLHQ